MGQTVGGFRLLEELGSGGFGSVFLGQDPAGRRAAVKLLHPHLAADPQVRRYFSQELVNARKVQGFCLAEVLDGDAEVERPWIATEYIDGPTLAQAVREHGPHTGGDLQRLAVQTITALVAIHAAGVVHRDFKPANILLGPDGPRVIDFGIARALDADTASATRIGTLGYMAPEQIEGTTLGPAVDVFAWGAVMVYAATGAEAFAGPTQAARINRVLNHPPETGDLADPLLGIVLACTDKDPGRRPTARQVWDRLLTGQAAPPPQAKARLLPTEPEDNVEALLRRSAEDGDVQAMNVLGHLLSKRGQAGKATEWYLKAAENGDTDAMISLGQLMEERGEVDEAETWYRRAAESGDNFAMIRLGQLMKEQGEDGEAEAWYRRAAESGDVGNISILASFLEMQGKIGEAEIWHRRAAESGDDLAMVGLGGLLWRKGETYKAESWYRKAAMNGSVLAMYDLAVLLERIGEDREAESWYHKAAKEGESRAMFGLGNLLERRGKVRKAESWYRRGAEEGHVGAMNRLAASLERRGKVSEAEIWYHRVSEDNANHAANNLDTFLKNPEQD